MIVLTVCHVVSVKLRLKHGRAGEDSLSDKPETLKRCKKEKREEFKTGTVSAGKLTLHA